MTVAIRHRAVFTRFVKILVFSTAILGATQLTKEIVLLSAYFGDLLVAIATSFVATFCFDYFYLPPVGTLHITAFSDWISLAAFLLASVIISRLTASAADYSKNADLLVRTLAQLNAYGKWLLSIPNDQLTLSGIALETLRIFSLEYCSIHVYGEGKWKHYTGTASSDMSQEIDARLKYIQDHPRELMDLVDENRLGVRYIQISTNMTPLAALVVKSETLPPDALRLIASMIGVKMSMVGEVSSP